MENFDKEYINILWVILDEINYSNFGKKEMQIYNTIGTISTERADYIKYGEDSVDENNNSTNKIDSENNNSTNKIDSENNNSTNKIDSDNNDINEGVKILIKCDDNNWYKATVGSYNHQTQKYKIKFDEYDEEGD